MSSQTVASAVKNSFAHLISGRGVSAKKAKEEENDHEEDDCPSEKKAEKDEPKDDKEDGKKSKKASKKKADDYDDEEGMSAEDKESEDDEEEHDEDDVGEDEKKEKEKNKKAKKRASAEGFDAATIARCESIFLSQHAAGRPDVAAKLAFHTGLSADEAIDVMASLPPVYKGSRLADKMAKVIIPDVGASDGNSSASADPKKNLAASIIGAYNKANGDE